MELNATDLQPQTAADNLLVHSAAAGAAFNRSATDFIVSTEAAVPELKKRGRRRKEPPSSREKREKEREKKARWRAKRKIRSSHSFHIEIPFSSMSKDVWSKIKGHLNIESNGSKDDEAKAFLYVLNVIGYEWENDTGIITRAPQLRDCDKEEELQPVDQYEP